MNLPNKITMIRVILSIVLLVLLIIPVSFPTYLWFGKITISLKYIIGGVVFLVASLTDSFDGYIARKNHPVTAFGKVMDAIADKMLVNSVLIILAATGFIHPIIPIVIIIRDTIVNSIKMIAASKGKVVAAIKSGKLKTICLMVGISLTLFYNLPFELYNIRIADFLLFIATVLSIVSGIQYYSKNRHLLFDDIKSKN